MRGLDPGITSALAKRLYESDGLPGQARQWRDSVSACAVFAQVKTGPLGRCPLLLHDHVGPKPKCQDRGCFGNNGAMRGDLIGRSEGGSRIQNYVTAASDW